MANETKSSSKQNKKNGLVPFIVIAVIFIATVGGIYLITKSGSDGSGQVNNSGTGNAGNTGGATEAQPLPNYASAPPGAAPAHFKGSESSPVLVEEFADFQCPTCAVVHPRMNEVHSRFGNRIKFVFRNYPLTTIHRNSYDAAVAAEAAGFQGKFWDMQNLLFVNQTQWSNAVQPRSLFEEYASKIGLDIDRFKNDMLGFGAKGRVDEDMRRARALNLTGTPTILVNGKVVNSYETEAIAFAVEAELKKFEPKEEQTNGSGENSNSGGNAESGSNENGSSGNR